MEMEEKDTAKLEAFDGLEAWRCPQLGGPAPFKYCRTMNEDRPCPMLIDCWGASVDVEGFLGANYALDELREIFGGPKKGRVDRIVETLERVKKEKGEAGDEGQGQ